MIVYWAVRAFAKAILKIIFRLQVEGEENLPADGPLIIAANHKSFLDPVVVGVAMRRVIRFIAKEELFRYPGFSWLIRQLAAFPVRREGHDVAALRKAVSFLNSGEAVGVFVEGTRIRREGLGEIKPGIYLLARLTGAPVYIAAISGTWPLIDRSGRFPRINRISIRFAKLDADPRSERFAKDKDAYLALLGKRLEEELAALKASSSHRG